MVDHLAALRAAAARYTALDQQAAQAKQALLDAAIAALKAGEAPAEVDAIVPFTAAYIRRQARQAGVEPAKRGRKADR